MTYAFFLINHFYSATSKLVLRGGGPKLGPLTGICLMGGVKCQIGGVVVHDLCKIYSRRTEISALFSRVAGWKYKGEGWHYREWVCTGVFSWRVTSKLGSGLEGAYLGRSPGSLRELLSISQAGWDVMNIFPQEQIQTKLLAGTVSSSLWVAMLWRLSTRWAKRKSTGSHFCIIYISDTSRSRKNSDTCRSQPASPEGWCFHYN